MTTPNRRQLVHVVMLLLSCCFNMNSAFAYPAALEEGSTCELQSADGDDSTSGTCVIVPQCPMAVKQLRATRTHHFRRCGFRGMYEVVCCPHAANLTVPPPSTTTSKAEVRSPATRKCAQVCDDLAERFAQKLSYQILGGVDAQLGEFPHMAALGYEGDAGDAGTAATIEWQCGGSLISERYVLTAAHCIVKSDQRLPVRVRLGKVDIAGDSDNATAQDFDIANITVHPGYKIRTKRNDIALLRLDRAVLTDANVYPACLYSKPDDPDQGLVITGWGRIEVAGEMNSVALQKGYLVPVPLAQCNASYQDSPIKVAIHKEQFCAISTDGKTDSCQGDSGGPLQIQAMPTSSIYSVVGVTSFGRGCGGSAPGIYTRVFSYLDWIESIVWPNQ